MYLWEEVYVIKFRDTVINVLYEHVLGCGKSLNKTKKGVEKYYFSHPNQFCIKIGPVLVPVPCTRSPQGTPSKLCH
jgi:hypothetical protein